MALASGRQNVRLSGDLNKRSGSLAVGGRPKMDPSGAPRSKDCQTGISGGDTHTAASRVGTGKGAVSKQIGVYPHDPGM